MKYSYHLIFLLLTGVLHAQVPSFESTNIIKGIELDTLQVGVISIKVEYLEAKGDSIFLRSFWPTQKFIYSNGKITRLNFLNPKTDSTIMTYNFDSLYRIISQQRLGEEVLYPIIEYYYDDNLHISSEITYRNDSSVNFRMIVKYNSNNQPIRQEAFKQDSILRSYWIFKYDSCGNLNEKLYINTKNGPGLSAFGGEFEPWPNDTTKYQINYYSNCKPNQIVEFSNSNLDAKTTFYYSGDTAITKREEFDFKHEISKLKLTKTIDSIRVEKTTYLNTSRQDSFVSYYISGVLKKHVSNYYGNTTITGYKTSSTFDNKGNWILKKFFENEILVRMIKRTIEYETQANNGSRRHGGK